MTTSARTRLSAFDFVSRCAGQKRRPSHAAPLSRVIDSLQKTVIQGNIDSSGRSLIEYCRDETDSRSLPPFCKARVSLDILKGTRFWNFLAILDHAFNVEGECLGSALDDLIDSVPSRYASRKVGKANAIPRIRVAVNECDVKHVVLLLFPACLFVDRNNSAAFEILSGVRHSYASFLDRMFKLPVSTLYGDADPAVLLQKLDQFSAVTFHVKAYLLCITIHNKGVCCQVVCVFCCANIAGLEGRCVTHERLIVSSNLTFVFAALRS